MALWREEPVRVTAVKHGHLRGSSSVLLRLDLREELLEGRKDGVAGYVTAVAH